MRRFSFDDRQLGPVATTNGITLKRLWAVIGGAVLLWGPKASRAEPLKMVAPEPRPITKAQTADDWDHVPLETSLGSLISLREFRGKLVLLRFFYTSCTTICGLESQQLAAVHRLWRTGRSPDEADDIVFISVTIDPVRDTLIKLRQYRSLLKEDGPSWIFARTTEADLATLTRHFNVITGGAGPLDHRGRLYLLAPEGYYLRGYSTLPRLNIPYVIEELGAARRAFLPQ